MRRRAGVLLVPVLVAGSLLPSCAAAGTQAGAASPQEARPLPPVDVLAAAAAAGWRVEGLRVAATPRRAGGVRVDGLGLRLLRPARPTEGLALVVDVQVEGPADQVEQARLDGLAIGGIEVLPPAEAAHRFGPVASAGAIVVLTFSLDTRDLLAPPRLTALGASGPPSPPFPAVVLVDGMPPADSIRPELMRAVDLADVRAAADAFGPRAGGGVVNHLSRQGPAIELPDPVSDRGWRPPGPTGKPLIIVDGVSLGLAPADSVDLELLDIDTVSIFQAPSAYRVFGERAMWGVIYITTKS